MYSEKELEEREYQLELVEYKIKMGYSVPVALAMLAIGATLTVAGYSQPPSVLKFGLYIAGMILAGMCMETMRRHVIKAKERKNDLITKFIDSHREKNESSDSIE